MRSVRYVVAGLVAAAAVNVAVATEGARVVATAGLREVLAATRFEGVDPLAQLPELGGLRKVMPFAAWMFILAGLSSMGMPGLAGFWAELTIFIGVWEKYPLIAVIAAICLGIERLKQYRRPKSTLAQVLIGR